MNRTTNTAHGSSSSGQTLQRSGNDAEYQRVVEDIPTIGIQKAFTYPAIFGPGTMGLPSRFALVPRVRIVSPTVRSSISRRRRFWGKSPRTTAYSCQMLAASLVVAYRVSWATGAAGWTNNPRWPGIHVAKGHDQGGSSANADVVSRSDDRWTDRRSCRWTNGRGVRPAKQNVSPKRIEAITVITPGQEWQLTCSTVNLASDTTYTPIAGRDFAMERFAELARRADVDLRRRAWPRGDVRVLRRSGPSSTAQSAKP